MSKACAWLLLGCLGAYLLPARAHAFSDSASFTAPAAEGGGGGRYFTGSAADGYTCKVCHTGGTQAPVRVLGLPISGYAALSSYEITIDWPDSLEHVSLAIEVSDEHGVAAGSLHVPPMNELQASERCSGAPFGAGQVMLAINRAVIAMPDCGAHQLRFLWTAPAEVRGAVRLSGALVHSDASESVAGDGVTEIAHVIGSRGSPNIPASTIHGCSITRAHAQTSLLSPLSWLTLALLTIRRRQRHVPHQPNR